VVLALVLLVVEHAYFKYVRYHLTKTDKVNFCALISRVGPGISRVSPVISRVSSETIVKVYALISRVSAEAIAIVSLTN
jgi:hypothetical protein